MNGSELFKEKKTEKMQTILKVKSHLRSPKKEIDYESFSFRETKDENEELVSLLFKYNLMGEGGKNHPRLIKRIRQQNLSKA